MECQDVRDALPEHAVGTLDPERARWVDRHLAWCAGCRKEARELEEGAAVLPLAAPTPAPPRELEDRIVGAVRREGRGRRPRTAAIAAALAATVAVGSLGWAVAVADRAERLAGQAASARARAEETSRRFEAVVEQLGGRPVRAATLVPARRVPGGGRAILYDGPQGGDFAVVTVGGLPPRHEPYRAELRGPRGTREVARLAPLAGGQLAGYRIFSGDVGGASAIVVVDRHGRVALRGPLTAASH